MRVRVLPDDRVVEVEVGDGVTVRELVERLGFSLEGVVVARGGSVLPEWERVRPGEELVVYRAVSGG